MPYNMTDARHLNKGQLGFIAAKDDLVKGGPSVEQCVFSATPAMPTPSAGVHYNHFRM